MAIAHISTWLMRNDEIENEMECELGILEVFLLDFVVLSWSFVFC